MRKFLSVVLSFALVMVNMAFVPVTETEAAVNSAAGTGNWRLVWSDEFQQGLGTSPDSSTWVYDIGDGGWGNAEIQYYTNSTSNVYITDTEGTNDGRALALRAKRESNGQFTSGRVKTLNKQYIKYGRIEAKLKVENGMQSGVWPAFWMMGNDIETNSWPNCGEIDIMEHRNSESEIIGTLHWNPNPWGNYAHSYAGSETNGQFAYIDSIANWHTYAVEWYEDCMKWFVDGVCFETMALTEEMKEEFHKPHFILLNVALGSTSSPFTKNQTVSSSFTDATMYVDYVRVYQGTDANFSIAKKSDTSNVPTEPVTESPYAGMTECAQNTWQSRGVWDYQLGAWAGASGYYSGGDRSDNFSLLLTATNKNEWGAMARVANIPVTPGHTYNYSVNFSSTKAGSVLIKEDVSAITDFTANVSSGDNTCTGTFTAGENQTTSTILVDLRGIDAGTRIDFKGYSMTDVTSGEPITEKPTQAPQETTAGTGETPSVPTTIDWSSLEYAGDGAGGGLYSNKYKFYCENAEVKLVNIQNPFSTADGLYVTCPAGISSSSLGNGNYDIQGAGILLHLSAFTAKETKFTITDAAGTYQCYVYYEDGAGSTVENPTEAPTERPTEKPTEKPTETPTEAVTDVVISDNLEINGYQISSTVGGMRTVYSLDSTVEGQTVTEFGLIYGIDKEGFQKEDMLADATNNNVYKSQGTVENGQLTDAISKSASYAMTMKFAKKTAEEFQTKYYVRAYAKLADGTYAYTEIEDYTIYDIADALYQSVKMNNYSAHNYLYDNILKVVKPDYEMKDYNWSGIIVMI